MLAYSRRLRNSEYSYATIRQEKRPHVNAKTGMAEDAKYKFLVKETAWDEFNATDMEPSKTTLH
jgi:hypothetical protein